MGKRGPQPAAKPGKTISAHVDAETLEDLSDVVYTRKRSQSFISAEAIRLGLSAVRELYAPVRQSKRKAAGKRPPAKASGAKKGAVKGKASASAAK